MHRLGWSCRTLCTYKYNNSRTLCAPFRLSRPNTVQAQVEYTSSRTRTHVQQVHRVGCHAEHCTRTRTVCTSKHTSSRSINELLRLPMPNTIHVHVQAVRALTCKRSTAQAAHAETCTRTRTECTPTHAHTRTTGEPFMRPITNIVHVQIQCKCLTPLTCNRWTAQTVHKRCATQTAHTEHCASTRTQISTRQVHHSVRTCRTPYTHAYTYPRRKIHRLGCTRRPSSMHKYTYTRTKVHRLGCKCRTPSCMHTRVKSGSQVPVKTLTAHPATVSSTRPCSTTHRAHGHSQAPYVDCTHAY